MFPLGQICFRCMAQTFTLSTPSNSQHGSQVGWYSSYTAKAEILAGVTKKMEKLSNGVKCSTVFNRRETLDLWKSKNIDNGWLKNPYEILFYVDHKLSIYLSTKVNLCRKMFYQAVHKFWTEKGVNKKKNLVTWIENEKNGVVYIERRYQLCTFLSYLWKANVEIQRITTPWKMSHIHSYKK